MTLPIDVRGFEADGVKVIPPTAPEFDDLARPLIGERVADTVLQLKPMLVIVSNESPQTIVSYSKVWRIADPQAPTPTTRRPHRLSGTGSGVVVPTPYPTPP